MKINTIQFIHLDQALKGFPESMHENIAEEISNSDVTTNYEVQSTLITVDKLAKIIDGMSTDESIPDFDKEVQRGITKLKKSVGKNTQIMV